MSWIAIDDVVGAIHHALVTEGLAGAVNTVALNPVTNAEFTNTLGRVLGRPALLPVPAPVLRLVLGEFSQEALGSLRVTPKRLRESGYEFRFPEIEPALRHVLGRF
jgi:NAD dependent epimerase/dehydratase family enzyme